MSKLSVAREKGIEIDVNVPQKLDSFPFLLLSVLRRMLGIILDNAVEESVHYR
ncbi:hypothetical protein ACQVGZ_01150 [Enterococcus lactis]